MAVDFSGEEVRSIEAQLAQHRPGGWRRLLFGEIDRVPRLAARAGWYLDVPAGQFVCDRVDYIHLLIDHAFPRTEPRVVIPSLDLGDWPHVEPNGVLCLQKTSWGKDPGDRAIECLVDASELLDYDDARCRDEFTREFSSYWNQRVHADAPVFLTLNVPTGPTRSIYFSRMRNGVRYVLGDNADSVKRWLQHAGETVGTDIVKKTLLIWLPQPWLPSEFPVSVGQVMSLFDRNSRDAYLRVGESLPVLFGSNTTTGPVFVGVEIPAIPPSYFREGFRAGHISGAAIAQPLKPRSVGRCRVERADPAWVHGRDRNEQQAKLAAKRIAIIGCGSLGAPVARLLAQTGIGRFIFVDHDHLSSPNTSRHVLGAEFVRENKAIAMRSMLLRDFPHLDEVEAIDSRFEKLNEDQLKRLATCDLIISAGIDFASDAHLDDWRRSLESPPVYLCTWVEAFALAGHAVALFGTDSLLDGFTRGRKVNFRLTDWPDDARVRLVEAGCGDQFQPHGAIELGHTVNVAAKSALDILTGDIRQSGRREWLGDCEEVIRRGGTPTSAFDQSFAIKTKPWSSGEH